MTPTPNLMNQHLGHQLQAPQTNVSTYRLQALIY